MRRLLLLVPAVLGIAVLALAGCPEEKAAVPAPPPQDFKTAATAYCVFERPLVLADPIQSKNIEKLEAESGQPALVRDEARWMPFCMNKQGKLQAQHGDEKMLAYFDCAKTQPSLVRLRSKCLRALTAKPKP